MLKKHGVRHFESICNILDPNFSSFSEISRLEAMRKSRYEISPSVKKLSANQPGNHCAALPGNQKQSQIEEDKRQLKTLPKHHHALAGEC